MSKRYKERNRKMSSKISQNWLFYRKQNELKTWKSNYWATMTKYRSAHRCVSEVRRGTAAQTQRVPLLPSSPSGSSCARRVKQSVCDGKTCIHRDRKSLLNSGVQSQWVSKPRDVCVTSTETLINDVTTVTQQWRHGLPPDSWLEYAAHAHKSHTQY